MFKVLEIEKIEFIILLECKNTLFKCDGMKHVCFILFPEFQLLSYVVSIETLRIANKVAGKALFSWETRTVTCQPLKASNGMLISPDIGDWSSLKSKDMILLCAAYNPLDYLDSGLKAFLAREVPYLEMLGGIDTGTVILAELGFLDGYQAVLHYEAEAGFRENWPEIQLIDQIYCLDKDRLTSAGGISAGDAMLNWIGKIVSEDIAKNTARDMIHGEMRQSQVRQKPLIGSDPVINEMYELIKERLSEDISIIDIASNMQVDHRHLIQRCKRILKMTPIQFLSSIRLDHAHGLIDTTELRLTEIAIACGFQSLSSFSTAFSNRYGYSPSIARKRRRFKHLEIISQL